MPKFSNRSLKKIETCDICIQLVMKKVIEHFDCTPIYGYRSPEFQFNLFMKGREKKDDGNIVIVNKSKVVTYCDGYNKKSKHNFNPSKAIDIIPYYSSNPHIRWNDTDRMKYFAGHVIMIARMFGIKMRWGGDWDQDTELDDQTFMDLAHFELID